MTIWIAGAKKEYRPGATLKEVAETERVENPVYVTAVVNEDYIKFGDFASVALKEGDRIEFVYFMGGGGYGVHQ